MTSYLDTELSRVQVTGAVHLTVKGKCSVGDWERNYSGFASLGLGGGGDPAYSGGLCPAYRCWSQDGEDEDGASHSPTAELLSWQQQPPPAWAYNAQARRTRTVVSLPFRRWRGFYAQVCCCPGHFCCRGTTGRLRRPLSKTPPPPPTEPPGRGTERGPEEDTETDPFKCVSLLARAV
ncbi:unnamed protein product [Pleuronectes platessa]|uniref:Uncharacterized protein n=1 Tax=Pleuronectes platessa TaxID=8262 RepID=A0A9N7VTQ3_PLEPL|nr:unnamed protein product [Pleuronectes platessa]